MVSVRKYSRRLFTAADHGAHLGLLSVSYSIAQPIDVKQLVAAIEASTGERTRITRAADSYVALSCRWINGVAELISSEGRVQLEVMLPVSEYFLVHVEAALAAAGAVRLEHDGSPSQPRPPNLLATKRWRSLSLGQRLAGGWVGQIFILLGLPFVYCGAVVRSIWRRFRLAS